MHVSNLQQAPDHALTSDFKLLNQMVFSWYGFAFPCVLTALQISITLALMLVLRATTGTRLLDFDPLPRWGTLKKVLPLTVTWWVYVVSGLIALRHLSVPMFSVFRRATTLLVMVGEWAVLDKTPTPSNVLSVALMMLGGLVAGATDLMFTLPGYLMVGVLVLSTAAYLLLIKLLRASTGLSDAGLLYANNILALPMMSAYTALATDELARVADFPRLWDPSFVGVLVLAASQAFLLNLCIFRCTNINSPLVTSVTGQIKDILTTTLGFLMFPAETPVYAPNVAGVVIGLISGAHYSYNSYMSRYGVKQELKAFVQDKKDTQ